MKKVVSMLLVFSIIISLCGQAFSATPAITIKVNSKVVTFKDVKPYMQNGLKAPLREIAEAMGATVANESLTADIVVTRGNVKMVYQANKKQVIINGKSYSMLDSVIMKNKRTIVPARFFVENIGGKLIWDAKTNTANITIAALPKPTEIVIPKANTTFKPWLPELKPVDATVKAELKKYADNKGTTRNLPENYLTNEQLIKEKGIEQVKEYAKLAKGYVESFYNIDYRKLDENYIKQLKYFYMPGSYQGQITPFIEKYAKSIIKNKVIVKCIYDVNETLVYRSLDVDCRARGRLYLYFSSADSSFFSENDMPKLKLNTWYQIDMEVGFAWIAGRDDEYWEHSQYSLSSSTELSGYTEITR